MSEIFKDIPWYEWYYKISNLWRIKSYDKYHKNISFLNPSLSDQWYKVIHLYKDWTRKCFKFHRLFAQAFLPNPDNKPEINHINSIRDDNRIENLEWVTHKENMIHSFKIIWRIAPWTLIKKKVSQINKLWEVIREWDCAFTVQKELWICSSTIWKACKWKYKTAWWYKWEYINKLKK